MMITKTIRIISILNYYHVVFGTKTTSNPSLSPLFINRINDASQTGPDFHDFHDAEHHFENILERSNTNVISRSDTGVIDSQDQIGYNSEQEVFEVNTDGATKNLNLNDQLSKSDLMDAVSQIENGDSDTQIESEEAYEDTILDPDSEFESESDYDVDNDLEDNDSETENSEVSPLYPHHHPDFQTHVDKIVEDKEFQAKKMFTKSLLENEFGFHILVEGAPPTEFSSTNSDSSNSAVDQKSLSPVTENQYQQLYQQYQFNTVSEFQIPKESLLTGHLKCGMRYEAAEDRATRLQKSMQMSVYEEASRRIASESESVLSGTDIKLSDQNQIHFQGSLDQFKSDLSRESMTMVTQYDSSNINSNINSSESYCRAQKYFAPWEHPPNIQVYITLIVFFFSCISLFFSVLYYIGLITYDYTVFGKGLMQEVWDNIRLMVSLNLKSNLKDRYDFELDRLNHFKWKAIKVRAKEEGIELSDESGNSDDVEIVKNCESETVPASANVSEKENDESSVTESLIPESQKSEPQQQLDGNANSIQSRSNKTDKFFYLLTDEQKSFFNNHQNSILESRIENTNDRLEFHKRNKKWFTLLHFNLVFLPSLIAVLITHWNNWLSYTDRYHAELHPRDVLILAVHKKGYNFFNERHMRWLEGSKYSYFGVDCTNFAYDVWGGESQTKGNTQSLIGPNFESESESESETDALISSANNDKSSEQSVTVEDSESTSLETFDIQNPIKFSNTNSSVQSNTQQNLTSKIKSYWSTHPSWTFLPLTAWTFDHFAHQYRVIYWRDPMLSLDEVDEIEDDSNSSQSLSHTTHSNHVFDRLLKSQNKTVNDYPHPLDQQEYDNNDVNGNNYLSTPDSEGTTVSHDKKNHDFPSHHHILPFTGKFQTSSSSFSSSHSSKLSSLLSKGSLSTARSALASSLDALESNPDLMISVDRFGGILMRRHRFVYELLKATARVMCHSPEEPPIVALIGMGMRNKDTKESWEETVGRVGRRHSNSNSSLESDSESDSESWELYAREPSDDVHIRVEHMEGRKFKKLGNVEPWC